MCIVHVQKFYAFQLNLAHCQSKLGRSCEARVGQNLKKEEYCRNQLKDVFAGKSAAGPFKQYKECLEQQRTIAINKCVPSIKKTCKSKALSVIKTVRMELETVTSLMDRYPNMRVIHLIRDPRSVVLSRIKSGWSTHGATNLKDSRATLKSKKSHDAATSGQSAQHVNASVKFDDFSLADEMKFAPKATNGVAQEAQMYCSLTRKDIITRRHLEQRYPGSTYQMIYDHMVSHPLHELERIYRFIDEPIPNAITSWVKTLNSGAKTSESIAAKWKAEMSVQTAQLVDKYCQNLYDTIDYTWPDPLST